MKRKPRKKSKKEIARLDDEKFGREMARMARDPQIQRVSAQIMREFRFTEGDGLEGL